MHRCDTNEVVLENESVKIIFDPHSKVQNWFMSYDGEGRAYDHHFIKETIHELDRKHVPHEMLWEFPYPCRIQFKDDTDMAILKIESSMQDLLEKAANGACNITDHNTFDSSREWFMFLICHKFQYVRNRYEFKILNYKLFRMLNMPYFKFAGHNMSLIDSYYMFSDRHIYFTTDGADDYAHAELDKLNGSLILQMADDFRSEAMEVARLWGLPEIQTPKSEYWRAT